MIEVGSKVRVYPNPFAAASGARPTEATLVLLDGTHAVVEGSDGKRRRVHLTRIAKPRSSHSPFTHLEGPTRVELDPDAYPPPPPACKVCCWPVNAHHERCPNGLRGVQKPMRAKRSRAYAAFVREHACQNCGAPPPSEHAHFGPRGMGTKADDRCANALCSACHRHWHDHGTLPARGFPGGDAAYSRAHSEARLYRWQVDLLIEWDDRQREGLEPEEGEEG